MTRQIGVWLLQVFQQPWVQYFLLPLVAALVTVLLRCLTRPGRKSVFEFKREDFLVGIGLGVTAFFTLATCLIRASERYSAVSKRVAEAQGVNNTAAVLAAQQSLDGLFAYLFGLTLAFVVFGIALIFTSLQMSHHGWETPSGNPAPVPKMTYLIGYDAVGLVLLVAASLMLGEL